MKGIRGGREKITKRGRKKKRKEEEEDERRREKKEDERSRRRGQKKKMKEEEKNFNKPNILTNILDVINNIITSSINNKDWIHNTNLYPIHLWLEAQYESKFLLQLL